MQRWCAAVGLDADGRRGRTSWADARRVHDRPGWRCVLGVECVGGCQCSPGRKFDLDEGGMEGWGWMLGGVRKLSLATNIGKELAAGTPLGFVKLFRGVGLKRTNGT